jgi:hypothetical protein
MLLCRPQADVDDQPALIRHHQARGVDRRDVRAAHASVHHRVPEVIGLFPEGEEPGEAAARVDHALVAAPRVVDEQIQFAAGVRNLTESANDLFVFGVIAGNADHRLRQIGVGDAAAGAEDTKASGGERDRHAAAHSATGAGDECGLDHIS